MNVDLLTTHIKHADYPIWRERILSEGERWNKHIIYFSEHNRFPYFDHFIHDSLLRNHLNRTIFVDTVETDWGHEDWRNKSTNEMLKYSSSDWIASIEQDWFCTNWNMVYEAVEKAMKTHDLIGWWQPNGHYIHPGFWFMKREALEKTKKDFGAHDGFDHFGWITKNAQDLNMKIISLQDMGFNCDISETSQCFHLGGVNQNYLEGLKPEYIFHRPDIFYVYNYFCRYTQVDQSLLFKKLSVAIEERLRREHPDFPNPEESYWKSFFI